MKGRAAAVARKHADQAVLAAAVPAHPGTPFWRWLTRDGTEAHAYDEAAGVPYRSACKDARWTVALRLGGRPCPTCFAIVTGGDAVD